MQPSLFQRSLRMVRPHSSIHNQSLLFVVFSRTIMWNHTAALENTYSFYHSMRSSVEITFCTANGEQRKVKARLDDTLKETADAFQIPIPGIFHVFFP